MPCIYCKLMLFIRSVVPISFLFLGRNWINPWTYKWFWCHSTPLWVFFFFFLHRRLNISTWRFQLLMFQLSLKPILRQPYWWSVTMVTSYNVINSRWSSNVWTNCFFQILLTTKSKLGDKINQSTYPCNTNSRHFYLIPPILLLGKIQDGGQDSDHYWSRHRPLAEPPPIKYTSSCQDD